MIYKKCTICGNEFPIDKFCTKGKNKYGETIYHSECNYCKNDKFKRRYAQRHEFIQSLKTPCKKCGNAKLHILEFHKRISDINERNSDFWHMCNIDVLLKEIQDYDTLCRNCHASYHYLNETYGMEYEYFLNNDVDNYD